MTADPLRLTPYEAALAAAALRTVTPTSDHLIRGDLAALAERLDPQETDTDD